MGTSYDHPEKRLSTDQKWVVGELVQGRDLAAQLQILLREPYSDQRLVSAEDLVVKIWGSFTNTLSVLSCCDQFEKDAVGSPAESGKCKGVLKNRRGCHNRRKHSETWTVISSNIEDGRVWRKYGQKEILNAKFPRSYYRCRRKYEQGCGAMKQVQRMEGDPIKYHTTYIGSHTCTDIFKAPQIIKGGYNSNYVVGSESKIPEEVHEMKPELIIKQETGLSNLTAVNASSLDSVNLWSGLEGLDSSISALMVPPRESSDSDHGGQDVNSTVYSRNATSSTTTDMDFAVGCLNFYCDDQFLFYENHLQFLDV